MSPTETNLEQLRANAAKLASIAEEQSEAFDEERQAEAELLDTVVEAVRPALRALSSRVQRSGHTWRPSSEEYFDWKGLRVDGEGSYEAHPRGNEGGVKGRDLYLTADGEWFLVEYTRRANASPRWKASPTRLSSMEVADDWSATSIVDEIADALERQLGGKRSRSTDAARARAEQFRSLAALLRGGVR